MDHTGGPLARYRAGMVTIAERPPAKPRLPIRDLAPDVYRAMVELDRAVRQAGLEPTVQQLVKVRASQLNGCAYCIDLHTREARQSGETERRLYALSAWREAPFFTPRERAALALTDAVTLLAGTHVPDEVYAEAARQFEQRELAALIFTIAVINAWNRIAVAARVVPRPEWT